MTDMPPEWIGKTREELLDIYFASLHTISLSMLKVYRNPRTKPLHGGVFGGGRYVVGSAHYVVSNVDYVTYFVMDEASRFVLSTDSNRIEAIAEARSVLTDVTNNMRIQIECGKFAKTADAWRAQQEAEKAEKLKQWRATNEAAAESTGSKVKSIGRRRRRIYDESGGKCHYCAAALTLDGKWHIEHKFPKALGGTNEPNNLVASCVTCNHRKKDTTDIEFMAKLAKEKQA